MAATSSGLPIRPSGICLSKRSTRGLSSSKARLISVAIAPGAMPLTVMPHGAELDGQVAGQELEPALAGAVGGEAGERHLLVHRADLDDLARPLVGEQVPHERLGGEEGRL